MSRPFSELRTLRPLMLTVLGSSLLSSCFFTGSQTRYPRGKGLPDDLPADYEYSSLSLGGSLSRRPPSSPRTAEPSPSLKAAPATPPP